MDRCYTIKAPDGTVVKVRAGEKPSPKTAMALLNLFKAAFEHLKSKEE